MNMYIKMPKRYNNTKWSKSMMNIRMVKKNDININIKTSVDKEINNAVYINNISCKGSYFFLICIKKQSLFT